MYDLHLNFFALEENAATSGTTATVCLLRNSIELVVAHVGDSRALLCRNGETKKLTTDHTADLKSEKVIFIHLSSFLKIFRHPLNYWGSQTPYKCSL